MPAPCTIDSPNVRAFLKLIRYAEHYPDQSDNFYLILFGGGMFSDVTTHPRKLVHRWGKDSTAAGAYGINEQAWDEAVKHGVAADFSPASQDRIAFWLIGTRHAVSDVCEGDVSAAASKLRTVWSSLPGATQSRMSLLTAKTAFVRFGGTSQ